MILEPDFDLGRRQIDEIRQLFSFRRRQILLLLKPALQLVDLRLRKQDPPLASRRSRCHAAHTTQGVMVVGEWVVMTATPGQGVVVRMVVMTEV